MVQEGRGGGGEGDNSCSPELNWRATTMLERDSICAIKFDIWATASRAIRMGVQPQI